VRATGIPKYLRNAPSIMESGGISPNRMMINSVITNHVILTAILFRDSLKHGCPFPFRNLRKELKELEKD